MKEQATYACPRCEYALVPVHVIESGQRRIVALTCPEPYCDHMQMVTRSEAKHFEARRLEFAAEARQAN